MARSPSLPLAPLPRLHFAGRFAAAAAVGVHEHAGSELVLVEHGACRITVADGPALDGGEGTLFILPAARAHDQVNAGFCRTTYLSFAAAPLAFSDRARRVELTSDDPARSWIEDIRAAWCDRHEHADGV